MATHSMKKLQAEMKEASEIAEFPERHIRSGLKEMKTIKYNNWLKKKGAARKVSSSILSRFDLAKLKRKPRDPEEEKWLKERGLESRFMESGK